MFTSEPGAAVAKPKAAAGKYGVVNMQSVILNVAEGKAARGELEKAIKAKETELKGKKRRIRQVKQRVEEPSCNLKRASKNAKATRIPTKVYRSKKRRDVFPTRNQRKEQAATQKIAMKVTKLVNDLAAKRGFEMVFETSSAGLVYLKNPVDLTKEVTTMYEAQSKAATKSAKK